MKERKKGCDIVTGVQIELNYGDEGEDMCTDSVTAVQGKAG